MKMDGNMKQLGERAWQAVVNGESLQEIQGIPQQTMDTLYTCAWNLYQQHKLDEAEVLFRYLCLLKARNKDHLMGLAAIKQLKKKYHRAIDLYATAHTLAGDDLRPMLQAGYCHLLIKNSAKARHCFEIVLASSPDPGLRQTAQGYVDVLDRKESAQNPFTSQGGVIP